MPLARYLTHPEVRIDPAVAVPDWGLNDKGRARTRALAASGALTGTVRIVTSAERKAVEAAEILSAPLGIVPEVRARMGENDRSATGFLPGPDFEAMADRFFAQPDQSAEGWERAVDAQARIMAEAAACLSEPLSGDILFVGHGAVGTLLWCGLSGKPISRVHDQPFGGHVFAFDTVDRQPLSAWQPMENLAQTPP